MNIVELLCENIERNENFFFSSNSFKLTRDNFKRITKDFLMALPEGKRDFLARQVSHYALLPHSKGNEVAGLGDILNSTELYCLYDYKRNRKHLGHSVSVFFLGLLLYHNLPSLKASINAEMEKSTEKLSGNTVYGEFLFRWRLASLLHDLGNGISLFSNNAEKIDDYLFQITIRLNLDWDTSTTFSVEYLLDLSRSKRALEEIDKIDGSDRFQKFFDQLKIKPHCGIYYDHGIVSALLILKVLDNMYTKYNEFPDRVDHHQVSFDWQYFDSSIMRSAYAVAMHNLDFYPDHYCLTLGNKLFDINTHPLSFLLKLADTLQEWQKPQAKDGLKYFDPEEIEIQFRKNCIVIQKFPKIGELRESIETNFNCGNIISMEYNN